MKKTWLPEELVEHWTLLPDELALLTQKNDENRLGFAILLKFFQIHARFPENQGEIAVTVVNYIAKVLNISPEKYSNYDWQGRSIKYHRAQIREFFGFREAKVSDAKELTNWLASQALIYELKFEQLKLAAVARLRELKLEPPTNSRLERIIRSALRDFESKFFSEITSQLSSKSKKQIDDFLSEKASSQQLNDTQQVLDTQQVNNIQQADDEVFHVGKGASLITSRTRVGRQINRTKAGSFSRGQMRDTTLTDARNTEVSMLTWAELKTDPGRIGVESFHKEVTKLEIFRQLELSADLFKKIPTKVLQIYKNRVAVDWSLD